MGFTGNGMLGAMLTAGGNTSVPGDVGSLRIELGRSDVVDDRAPTPCEPSPQHTHTLPPR